jgi:hypothetical protein
MKIHSAFLKLLYVTWMDGHTDMAEVNRENFACLLQTHLRTHYYTLHNHFPIHLNNTMVYLMLSNIKFGFAKKKFCVLPWLKVSHIT